MNRQHLNVINEDGKNEVLKIEPKKAKKIYYNLNNVVLGNKSLQRE
jgi:hypothetical protein